MRSGLLWFDKSNAPLTAKVEAAADRYRQKFGTAPNRCYCHPANLNGEAGTVVGGVELAQASNVLKWHLWIGVEQRSAENTNL